MNCYLGYIVQEGASLHLIGCFIPDTVQNHHTVQVHHPDWNGIPEGRKRTQMRSKKSCTTTKTAEQAYHISPSANHASQMQIRLIRTRKLQKSKFEAASFS